MGVEPASAANGTVAARPWWESRLLLAARLGDELVPLLYPPIPPLVDLFGHMGRYRVELDLDQSAWLQRYFNYHWAAIGNLGVDLLVMLLAPLLGLEPAVKLIVLLHSAADRRRLPVGGARSAWPDSADGLLRAAVRLRLSRSCSAS